jgi:hypothetical protein
MGSTCGRFASVHAASIAETRAAAADILAAPPPPPPPASESASNAGRAPPTDLAKELDDAKEALEARRASVQRQLEKSAGGAVQVEFSSPWFQPLKLKCDFLVSNVGFEFNVYRYTPAATTTPCPAGSPRARRRRKPRLRIKPPPPRKRPPPPPREQPPPPLPRVPQLPRNAPAKLPSRLRRLRPRSPPVGLYKLLNAVS